MPSPLANKPAAKQRPPPARPPPAPQFCTSSRIVAGVDPRDQPLAVEATQMRRPSWKTLDPRRWWQRTPPPKSRPRPASPWHRTPRIANGCALCETCGALTVRRPLCCFISLTLSATRSGRARVSGARDQRTVHAQLQAVGGLRRQLSRAARARRSRRTHARQGSVAVVGRAWRPARAVVTVSDQSKRSQRAPVRAEPKRADVARWRFPSLIADRVMRLPASETRNAASRARARVGAESPVRAGGALIRITSIVANAIPRRDERACESGRGHREGGPPPPGACRWQHCVDPRRLGPPASSAPATTGLDPSLRTGYGQAYSRLRGCAVSKSRGRAGDENDLSVTGRTNPHQTAQAGRRVVVAELQRRDATDVTFLQKERQIDVRASNAARTRTVTIRVKTKTRGNWHASVKDGAARGLAASKQDFWVLVDLGPGGQQLPKFFVMPGRWIREHIDEHYAWWLSIHGGQRPVNPASPHVAIEPSAVAQWQDRWDVLGIF